MSPIDAVRASDGLTGVVDPSGESVVATMQAHIPPLGLIADIWIPADRRGLVIFAHGSGSGRLSPRNRWVAQALVNAEYATLLFDLLTEDEAARRASVFDIDLLAQRLVDVVDWAGAQPELRGAPTALFGASTGAAAAIKAAAARPVQVKAVISRGGRPDLAVDAAPQVQAPTLLLGATTNRC